jgi:hypothetical protein
MRLPIILNNRPAVAEKGLYLAFPAYSRPQLNKDTKNCENALTDPALHQLMEVSTGSLIFVSTRKPHTFILTPAVCISFLLINHKFAMHFSDE